MLIFFTNMPLTDTIDIRTNTLFETTEIVEGLSKIELNEPSSLATKESYFILNEKLYKRVDGVARNGFTFRFDIS